MLETALPQKASAKTNYKQEIKRLKAELSSLQQTIKEHRLPVLILFEGWGASGKGSMISETISALDPRSFKVYSAASEEDTNARKPWLWRYWEKLPEYGRFSILDRSWYKEISTERIEKELSKEEVRQKTESINIMERQLCDDGYLILKFFLHISQKEQKERFEKLTKNKSTAWRVTEQDWRRNKEYDSYYKAFDEMCIATDTPHAPWHLVNSRHKEAAVYEVLSIMVGHLQKALENQSALKSGEAFPKREFKITPPPLLQEIPLSKALSDEEYDELLKEEQKKLKKIQSKLYQEKIPAVIVFEGWDAAGKGGAIKRVAAALDPRGYEAVPVAAPDKQELNHHYLWRFWRNLPKTGHITLFDRSWYGRVMVERIEGFTSKERWSKAYQEMNEFEYELHQWGAAVMKFWLQIDKEEQLQRFTERQNTPEKRWKITDEDWRNREKWDDYEVAVNEMLQKTSTDFAPWYIIEAKDKKYARIKVLKTINKILEAHLKEYKKKMK